MSARKMGKIGIEGSRPDLPPFLQRMREQIVEAEDVQRKADSERRRKNRSERPDDDFTVVKLAEEDLSEEEYHKMKLELELRMKSGDTKEDKIVDLDIDSLIQTRLPKQETSTRSQKHSHNSSTSTQSNRSKEPEKPSAKSAPQAKSKKLSYDTSEDEDD